MFVCLFACGSALLQPARSVCVASGHFFIGDVIRHNKVSRVVRVNVIDVKKVYIKTKR